MSKRDEQLRFSLIDNARRLGGSAEGGWVSGSKLAIAARDGDRKGVEDEVDGERLIDDLIQMSLLVEKPRQPFGNGQRELRHRFFKLTDLGWQLWAGQIDPMPGVATREET